MADLVIEPGTPDWWSRAVLALGRAKADRATQPVLLQRFATTANLPAASAWPGGLAFHVALGVPVISNGTSWFPVTVGAAL